MKQLIYWSGSNNFSYTNSQNVTQWILVPVSFIVLVRWHKSCCQTYLYLLIAPNVIFQSFILCSQVSTVCWLSRLINLNQRFPQAAFPSSNERQVPVKVGATLLSNIKIEAFSSLAGAWRGLEGWLLRPAATTCFACSRCHWCPFLVRAESLRV